MARRVPGEEQKEQETTAAPLREATLEEQGAAATTGIPGGAPGLIPGVRTALSVPGASRPSGQPKQSNEVAVPDRYSVKGPGPHPDGTWPILYGGVRVFLRPGKEVSSSTYDIAYLKAQGVQLEPIK